MSRTLGMAALALIAVTPLVAQEESATLYAGFDGKLSATHAAGDGQASINGLPRFVEGVKGQAVVVGGDNWLSYAAAGNLNPAQGSVEFWLKPLDWDGRDDRDSHFFVGAAGADRLYIYKFARWRHFTFHCRSAATPNYESLQAGIYAWQAGEWHHAVVTWDRATMRIYLDGELKSEASIPAPLEDLGDTLYVGRELATPQFAAGETALDELYVYPRPLFPEEVRRAYTRLTEPAPPEL
ncbi:MAG TPA: LamG domain-containing protein, partial [Armatimonadota bacterium]|nr:LamG domain-containing protein [Armatimonadota bacterium]